ncbi:hypothetical protein [Planococcus donghaensis]
MKKSEGSRLAATSASEHLNLNDTKQTKPVWNFPDRLFQFHFKLQKP